MFAQSYALWYTMTYEARYSIERNAYHTFLYIIMSTAFDSIKQGLIEAIEFAQGKPTKAIVHDISPVDVKAIRARVGMSQAEFASAFGMSLGTLRHWERGDRTPRGPARVLLNVIAKEPHAVLRALSTES